MGEDSDDISKIKDLLKNEPRGLSIRQITDHHQINRNLAAKYLDMLLISGQVEMRTIGMAKMYYLSHRVPITAMMDFSSEFIVVLDENLKIIQLNDHFLEFSRLNRDTILGKTIGRDTIPLLAEDETLQAARDSLKGKEIAKEIKWQEDGKDQFYHTKFIPTVFENGSPGITIILEETTEIKNAEHSLRNALHEKEILLGDINQRINDNLQLILSLIELQVGSVPDESTKEMLRETQNRIMTLALVYSQLGKARPGMSIDVSDYIRNLVGALLASYHTEDGKIQAEVEVSPITMTGDKATTIGLVLNELISYTVVHAFPKKSTGTIHVIGSVTDTGYLLQISSDGAPFSRETDLSSTDELGLQLAYTLITKQLSGTISINTNSLKEFDVSLPESDKQ
jgi:PAS domain S-box-containing protein